MPRKQREKCLGLPIKGDKPLERTLLDKLLGRHPVRHNAYLGQTDCNNPVPPGEDFCDECGDALMANFRKAWGDIAQMEAPNADRKDIDAGMDRILGPE